MQIDRETVQRWKREFTGDKGLCDVDLWVYIGQRAAEQERSAMLKELDTWSDLKAGKVAMLIRARQLEPA